MFTRICTTLLLTISLSFNAVAADLSRAAYGATHLPIWSELTYFERTTLSDLHKARNNDPDALLALYLVGSGVRELAEYETVNRRIHAFAREFEEGLVDKKATAFIGERLNTQMHREFFLREGKGKAPSGYDAEQSRLMGIFETGVFNCISSAMLYIVLAKHFKLDVQGVLLPSHAFVQVNSNKGPLEVETTSPQGFGQAHTPEFYHQQSGEWYDQRGLAPATYEDYLRRQRVSPVVLGAKNMLNQHTATGVMPYADGSRLAEISAFIHPGDLLAQEKRLHFYNNELHRLATNGHWDTLARLFAVSYRQVLTDTEALGTPQSLVEPLLYFQLGALRTYAQLGDTELALATLADIAQRHPAIPEQQENIETELTQFIGALAEVLSKQGAFEQALDMIPAARNSLPSHDAWVPMIRLVYMRWVEMLWQKKQWQDVIYVATDWREHPELDENDAKALEVLQIAHQQMVVTALQNKEFETALAHVELCELSQPPQVCSASRALLKGHL